MARLRCLGAAAAVAATIVLAACGGNSGPLGELKPEEARAANKGVVVVAVEMAGHVGSLACHSIGLMREGGGGGTYNIANGQFTLPGAPGVLQLQAGSYAVTEVECAAKPRLLIKAPGGTAYGRFTLQAGEFVNIGRIVVIDHYETEHAVVLGVARKHVAFVLPIEQDKLTDLRKDVAGRMVTRLMAPGLAVPVAERQRMCELQRKRARNSLFTGNAPDPMVCRIA